MRRIYSVFVVGTAMTIGIGTIPSAQATDGQPPLAAIEDSVTSEQMDLGDIKVPTVRKISGRLPDGAGFRLPPVGQPPFPTSPNSPGLPGSRAPAGVVEPPPSYVPQTSCDPVEKKGIRAFKSLVMRTYPAGRDWGSVRDCAADGISEHLEGRAWDWNVDVNNPTQFTQAGQLLGWLTANGGANAQRLGIMYIGYNYRIWGAYRASEGWRALSNSNPHTDHVHFSFTWNGAQKQTSFWKGSVRSQDYGPCRRYQGQPAPLRVSKNTSPCPASPPLPLEWRSASLLWRGSTGSLVTSAQTKLGISASGSFGASTAQATANFQRLSGIPVTGAVDAPTWFALGMGAPVSKVRRHLKRGMKGGDVRRLQRALHMQPKKRNGRFKLSTARAVKGWKRSHGLRPKPQASKGFQRRLGL
ncbi:MAG: peptidoglycan-binding protein [Actinobacteria bacterium]|nr:peptidoglycan-binding protein [Actinomycetota bacterium]